MRHTVTYDSGTDRTELERIYDRLRKRSWRYNNGYVQYKRPDGTLASVNRLFMGNPHEIYIRGLKDALNAVRESRGQ